jgi:hypothetical protein
MNGADCVKIGVCVDERVEGEERRI